MSKDTINRLPTGVPELDQVLGGGLPEFSFNLIGGSPGCGKTTLAHQLMFTMASEERPALYFTVLDEPALKMLRYQQQFDFFDPSKINHAIRFVNLSAEAAAGDLNRVIARIASEVQAHARGWSSDSFRSIVRASSARENKLQQFIQDLGMLMASWQATTFLVGEYSIEHDANPIVTLADGVDLASSKRATQFHDPENRDPEGARPSGPAWVHTFRIGNSGLKVFPPAGQASEGIGDRGQNGFDHGRSGVPKDLRLRMGLPELDEMLGGGLPSGYSLLVSGPSGSCKTILATSFLAEGARAGETGVIAVFEQNPYRSRNRVLADLISAGKVALIDSRSPDLSRGVDKNDAVARRLPNPRVRATFTSRLTAQGSRVGNPTWV